MYHILEMQTNGNSSVIVTPIPVYENRLEAESVYHQKLSYAAISSVEIHSVVMIDQDGTVQLHGTYKHATVQPSEA